MPTPNDFTPIETFLATLANCPDLESLQLTSAGPALPEGDQGDCGVVVQLCKLEDLTLQFEGYEVVGYILIHLVSGIHEG